MRFAKSRTTGAIDPVAWLLLRVIEFGYFAAGQVRRRFSFPHAVFARYAVSVVNNTVQNRVG